MHSTATGTRKLSGTLDPLSPEEALRIMNRAKKRYEAMGRYDPQKADKIAAQLFRDLTWRWIGNPVVLGRACGISPAALWKWKTRRAPVHIDTVARACDRLARMLISGAAPAEEAANLMAAIPWTGKKTGSQLLRYAVAHGLSSHSLFHLARRQERLNASDHARSLRIPIALLARMAVPPDCDRGYAMWRGNRQLNTVARRFGLETADDIAEFKLMVRHGSAVPRPSQHELAQAFREGAAKEPRARFLRRFFSLLKARHGLRTNGELAQAVIERITPSGALKAADAIRLERRLSNVTKPTHNCVRLLPVWAGGMAGLAFPGEAEVRLRKALIRYLVASRQPDREGLMSSPSPARKSRRAGETAMGHPMTRERHGAHLSGFTLLELAIVLVIIALVTGMAITSGISVVETARLTATQKKMKAIDDALMQYRASNDRLPCPANLTITPGSANYGLEAGAGAGSAIGTGTGVCTGTGMLPAANFTGAGATNTFQTAAEGAIPAITLGLPPDFMYDGWGNRFRYAVDISYTAGGMFASSQVGCTPNAAITVNDSNGNARSSGSVYALISSGANGHGAYTSEGVTVNAGSVNANELTNCHCTSGAAPATYAPTYVQMQQTLDPANNLDSFDDLVSYKERWQMRTDWDKVGCGYIYVADCGGNRIEIFNSGGVYQSQIGACSSGACTTGTGNGQFNCPAGLAFDSSGHLWAVDSNNNRIEEFSSAGAYLGGFTAPFGTGNGQLQYPSAVAVDASGYLWVSDDNARIQKFNAGGMFQMNIGSCPAWGITLDSGGNIWVSCGSAEAVQEYSSSGVLLRTVGNGGNGNGQFSSATGGAFDGSGNLWEVDAGNNRVQEFNSTGTWLASLGGTASACTSCLCTGPSTCPSNSGSGNGQFNQPYFIAIDASRNFWITDNSNNRVEEFSSGGAYLSQFGSAGSGNGQFNASNGGPSGIAIGGR